MLHLRFDAREVSDDHRLRHHRVPECRLCSVLARNSMMPNLTIVQNHLSNESEMKPPRREIIKEVHEEVGDHVRRLRQRVVHGGGGARRQVGGIRNGDHVISNASATAFQKVGIHGWSSREEMRERKENEGSPQRNAAARRPPYLFGSSGLPFQSTKTASSSMLDRWTASSGVSSCISGRSTHCKLIVV
ncbi:unnamed protein product [Victoria cruziana]